MKGQRATLRKLRVELKLSKFEFSLIRGQRFNQLGLTSGPILKITGEQTIAVQVITNLILFTVVDSRYIIAITIYSFFVKQF